MPDDATPQSVPWWEQEVLPRHDNEPPPWSQAARTPSSWSVWDGPPMDEPEPGAEAEADALPEVVPDANAPADHDPSWPQAPTARVPAEPPPPALSTAPPPVPSHSLSYAPPPESPTAPPSASAPSQSMPPAPAPAPSVLSSLPPPLSSPQSLPSSPSLPPPPSVPVPSSGEAPPTWGSARTVELPSETGPRPTRSRAMPGGQRDPLAPVRAAVATARAALPPTGAVGPLTVLARVDRDLERIAADPALLRDPDLALWTMTEPGALTRAVDPHGGSPSAVLGLLPVGVVACYGVLVALRHGGAAGVGGLLDGWVADPWPLGPGGLAMAVLIALVVLGADRVRAGRGRHSPAALATAQAELATAVTRLRRDAGIALKGGTGAGGADLAAAVDRLAGAAEVFEGLRSVVTRLEAATPTLLAQAEALAAVDQRLAATAEAVARHLHPTTDLVTTTLQAATLVRDAVAAADRQVRESAALAVRAADQSAAMSAGERPFTIAAERMDVSATALAEASTALRDSMEKMEAAIEKANWLALVADGLRGDDPHEDGEAPPVLDR